MASPPTPAKMKAFLADIKTNVLDGAGDDDTVPAAQPQRQLQLYYLTLLRLEIAQRGVLVDVDALHADADGKDMVAAATKIFDMVQSTAGKAVLDIDNESSSSSSSLPKPLLAGAAVMAGRVTERVASTLSTAGRSLINNEARVAFKRALDRCEVVEDHRLRVLLLIGKESSSSSSSQQDNAVGVTPHATATTTGVDSSNIIRRWLLSVAEAYFYRATYFTPDTPPMWKRAWDVITERRKQVLLFEQGDNSSGHNDNASAEQVVRFPAVVTSEYCWEAVTAITNLHRIATMKGNMKRAAELSLCLSECYLDRWQSRNHDYDEGLTKSIGQAFLADYRPVTPYEWTVATEAASKALDDYKGIMTDDDATSPSKNDQEENDSAFHVLVLELRVALETKTASIEHDALNEYRAMKNRVDDSEGPLSKERKGGTGTVGPSAVATTRESIASKIKDQRFMMVDDSSLQAKASALIESLLRKTREQQHVDENRLSRSAFDLVFQYLARQHDKAKAIAIETKSSKGWVELASTIRAMFLTWQQRAEGWNASISLDSDRITSLQEFINSLSVEERNVVESAAVFAPVVEWMCCVKSPTTRSLPTPLLIFAHDILSLTHRKALANKKDRQKSAGVVSSAKHAGDKLCLRFECALASTRALISFTADNFGRMVHALSQEVVMRASKVDRYNDLAGEFGFPYFDFLVTWCGIVCQPWQYVNISEARRIVTKARDCLLDAEADWGRSTSECEKLLLNLGQAEAEGVAFSGGLLRDAESLFNTLVGFEDQQDDREQNNGLLSAVLRSRGLTGLSKLALGGHSCSSSTKRIAEAESLSPEALAQRGLREIQKVKFDDLQDSSLYLWNPPTAQAAMQYQLAYSRQLMAETLLRQGKDQDAKQFLEEAVREAPQDPGASFALGAFMLRMMFAENERSPQRAKASQIQLLKAAKLDANKAGPFALLGYWYEFVGDKHRAIGCYSKSLQLDPAQSVAGRGLLRLKAPQDTKRILEDAVLSSSPHNGWAWRAVGYQKAMLDGEDELAVVSYVKALRCVDIERNLGFDSMAAFYDSPFDFNKACKLHEQSEIRAELGAAYHRLGRYTASLRSFQAAIVEAGESVPSAVLCVAAQVELELGLYSEAVEKFKVVLQDENQETRSIAAYGHGLALLRMAQRDSQDGKAGAAFFHIQRAISGCQELGCSGSACLRKLVGDLHSFGAALPVDVFEIEGVDKLSFISAGEEAYLEAEKLISNTNEDEVRMLRSSLVCDRATNILLQAQLLSFRDGKGVSSACSTDTITLFHRASSQYQRAIELFPCSAVAWTGLGCALSIEDSLMAQHAFCRSVELDPLLPESYANLSCLYTTNNSLSVSARVLDALTQVADSPMMWINRALILERQGELGLSAADAYRAALQTSSQPAALLGLALTSDNRKECHECILEYVGNSGQEDVLSRLLSGMSLLEAGCFHNRGVLATGQQQAVGALELNLKQSELSGNRDCLRDILEVARSALEKVRESSSKDPSTNATRCVSSLSTTQRIILEPGRGDLWVELVKEMVAQQDFKSNDILLESCRAGARRSVMILSRQLKNFSLDATILSDALSLQFWVEAIAEDPQQGQMPKNPVDLQRSLLICPQNRLARDALHAYSKIAP